MKKIVLMTTMFLCIMMPMFTMTLTAHATDANEFFWDNTAGDVQANTGLSNNDPRVVIGRLINAILGFLGIIALVIILAAGFKWMTSNGDEGKIDEAKKMMSAGVIGMVIVLLSYGIAQFVMNMLYEAAVQ